MRVAPRVSAPRESSRGVAAVLLIALSALGAAPAAAGASSARIVDATIQYSSAPGERNDVHAEPVAAGSYRITDSVAISAGSGCRASGANGVTCTATRVDRVSFELGDGDDRLSAFDTYVGADAEARVEANGGTGRDQLVAGVYTNAALDGGADGDKVIVGDGGGSARGGDGSDQIEAAVDFEGSLDGGSGDDTFALVGYRQSVSGGPGRDTASYYSWSQCCTPGAVRVALDGAANDGPGGRDDIGGDVEVVEGGSGGDALSGNDAANTLSGLGGGDTLSGQGGDDYLFGEDGADDLTGGAGTDYLQGGAGDDRIDSRDGASDSVICGPGRDSVAADLSDLVASDCESVSRPPGTPETREPTPIVAPSPLVVELARTQSAPPRSSAQTTAEADRGGVLGSTSAGVGISRRAARLRGGVVRVRLSCPAGSRLTGVVTLTDGRSRRKLGSARFRCASSRTVVAKVKLSARARRLVAGRKSARVRIRVVARDGSGDVSRATRLVRLRAR